MSDKNNNKGKNNKKRTNFLVVEFIAKFIYYFILLILFTVYVIKNWYCVTRFTFFSDFNGHNLLFILWLILIFMPLIGNFEGFGIKLNSLFNDQQRQSIIEGIKQEKEKAEKEASKQPTTDIDDEIEKLKAEKEKSYREIIEESGDENV